MTIRTAQIGAIEIAYEIDGPADAPVVMLSHCFCSDHRFWDAHLPACEGYRVLRYDTRGHGASGRPPGPYTLDMLAGDAVGLLDTLGIEKVHFVGVSMGGMIGQTVALSFPQRLASLALVNTTPTYSEAQRVAWRERAGVVLRDGMAAVHEGLMQRWFTDAAISNGNAGYQYMVDAVHRFPPESFDAVTAAMCQLDTTARLSDIRVPTVVVAAPDDPGVPPELSEKLAHDIPGAQLHWLTPARHLATLEHVDVFNDLLRAHLMANAGPIGAN
ncbi:MAG: alpha/beta fold hydrolase [Hyphomicrobiaceae bacterium]